MGRKNKKPTPTPTPTPIPKPPSPTVSFDNDVISATSSSQHDTVSPSPPPKPKLTTTPINPPKLTTTTPTVVSGLPALPSKRSAVTTTATNASEKKLKKLKPSDPTTTKPDPISEEDDIVILKGFLDYKSQNGVDPLSNIDDFFDFIKPSLKLPHLDKGLIVNKVHQLKTKFRNPKKKKDLTPHEIRLFELSKTIWAKPEVIKPVHAEENAIGGNEKDKEKFDDEEEEEEEGDVEFGFSGEDGEMLREVMKVMEGEERKEFRNKVKKASVAYLDAYLLRLEVLEAAAKKVLDGIKNDEF